MKKLLRITAYALLTVVALVIVFALTIPLWLNPNDYKDVIRKQTQEYLGYEVELNGDIHWSFFPKLSLQLNDVEIENPSQFLSHYLAKIDHLSLAMSLIPLFSRELVMQELTIQGVTINVEENNKGARNIDGLMELGKKENTQEKPAETAPTTATPLQFNVSAINIADATLNWITPKSEINLTQFNFQAHGVETGKAFPAKLNFTLTDSVKNTTLAVDTHAQLLLDTDTSHYTINQFVLDANLTDPAMPNKGLKAHLKGDMDLMMSDSGQLNVEHFQLTVDDSTTTGNFSVKDFDAMLIQFNVDIDKLDLDRYQETASNPTNTGAASKTSEKAANNDPWASIRTLNMNGHVHIGALKAANLHVNDINLDVKADKGIMRLVLSQAKLYDGLWKGSVEINGQQPTGRYQIQQTLQNVNIEPLLKDAAGTSFITGTLNANLQANAQGNQESAVLNSLQGNANLSLQNGTLPGMDIVDMMKDALTALKVIPPSDGAGSVSEYQSLTGTLNFQGGKATNNDLVLKSSYLRGEGRGEINFHGAMSKATIDYHLNSAFISSSSAADTPLSQQTVPIVPILIKGPLNSPNISVDMAGLLSNTNLLKQPIKDLTNQVGKDVQKQLEKGLRSLIPH